MFSWYLSDLEDGLGVIVACHFIQQIIDEPLAKTATILHKLLEAEHERNTLYTHHIFREILDVMRRNELALTRAMLYIHYGAFQYISTARSVSIKGTSYI